MPNVSTKPLEASKTDSPIDAGFDTLACMPEQLLPFSSLAANLQPEKRLMLAVLEDAVTSYFRHAFTTTHAGAVEFREATTWIDATDTAWPFSFVNICTTLSIEPDYVRRGLSALTLADVNRVIRENLRTDNMQYVFVTRDADDLRQRLVSDQTSPISYDAEKPIELLEEDQIIDSIPLGIEAGNVRIISAEKVFN